MIKKSSPRLICKYCGAIFGWTEEEERKRLAIGDFLIHVIQGHEINVDELLQHIKESNHAVVEGREAGV